MGRGRIVVVLFAGAVRAAFLSAALYLAAAVVPLVGAIISIFAPAPVLLFAVGYGGARSRALAAIMIAAGAVVALGGWTIALGYVVTFGFAAIVMCDMLERRKPFEVIVLVSGALVLAASVIAAFALAGSAEALTGTVRDALAQGMSRGQDFYKLLGIETGMTQEAEAGLLDTILRLSPALVAMCAGFGALLNLAVFWRLGGRGRVSYPLFGDLARWSTPEWLIWVLLATGFGMFVPVPALAVAALDAFVCVAAVYFCQGLAIMAYYFKALAIPPWVRGLIYFVTVIQPVLAGLVCAAGIFDLWVDFRRLKPPSQEAGSFGDFF
ncbi:MAG TPA: DUF2232 domain-containing protein [Candidatus Binataceae bacterium]|nr:DUF2232 domain-containing protein [Candidatus Binataceae bacterium]